jgi:hypothetical protein
MCANNEAIVQKNEIFAAIYAPDAINQTKNRVFYLVNKKIYFALGISFKTFMTPTLIPTDFILCSFIQRKS